MSLERGTTDRPKEQSDRSIVIPTSDFQTRLLASIDERNLCTSFYRKMTLGELGIHKEDFLRNIRPLYDTLSWDKYDVELGGLASPCRKRAVSEFAARKKTSSWDIFRVQARPYAQPFDHGTYKRTTPRLYNDVPAEFLQHQEFQAFLSGVTKLVCDQQSSASEMRIILTFLRTVAKGDEAGRCTLEGGPHYDGMDYIVSALVVNRKNLQKDTGISTLLTPDGKILDQTVLQPGEFIFQDDKRLMHDITNIYCDPESGSEEGYRDMIGVDVQITS